MRPISTILASRPQMQVLRIAPGAMVIEALRLMADRNVGALLVMEDERIVGIMSERDYARKVALKNMDSRQLEVQHIMSSPVMCVGPHQTNEECLALMTNNRIRHLPVMEHGRLIGMVSIGDLVKDIINELEFSNDQLMHYISGDHGTLVGVASYQLML